VASQTSAQQEENDRSFQVVHFRLRAITRKLNATWLNERKVHPRRISRSKVKGHLQFGDGLLFPLSYFRFNHTERRFCRQDARHAQARLGEQLTEFLLTALFTSREE
jgi:hypothetical protein